MLTHNRNSLVIIAAHSLGTNQMVLLSTDLSLQEDPHSFQKRCPLTVEPQQLEKEAKRFGL